MKPRLKADLIYFIISLLLIGLLMVGASKHHPRGKYKIEKYE